jgi:hypothetical protein
LVAKLADEFQILSRGSGGTELRMRFNLSARADAAGESSHSTRDRRQLIAR